jgi:sugar/nucleoside kinase (ribokinase family)
MPVDLCCIGHITLDHVITPEDSVTMPGGTAFYFSRAIQNMDVRYALVTSLAETEMPFAEALRNDGIAVTVLPSGNTVVFENRYAEDFNHRTQRVLATADPFTAENIRFLQAKVFHLGPLLAADFSAGAIEVLSGRGKLSLDVQGFLRRVEGEKVVAIDWKEKKELLPLFQFVKVNEEEMHVLTGESDAHDGARTLSSWGAKEVIVTLGSKGSVVYDGRKFYTIPAYAPASIHDATGCGDTYMAGYLYRRIRGSGIQEAGEFAAAMASIKIAASGPFDGTEEDVEIFLKEATKQTVTYVGTCPRTAGNKKHTLTLKRCNAVFNLVAAYSAFGHARGMSLQQSAII